MSSAHNPATPFAVAFISIAVVGSGVASYLAFSPERSGHLAFWMLTVGPTSVLAAIAAVWAQRQDLLREWISPRWGDFTRGILGAVGLFLAAWGITHVAAPVGSPREIWLVSLYGQIGDPRGLQAHASAVAAVVLVAAVGEEIVWRGAVTQLLARRRRCRRRPRLGRHGPRIRRPRPQHPRPRPLRLGRPHDVPLVGSA
jgi:membrane protease YdiL (CAAX protease family)